MKMERVILHSDLNNFYASVACLYDPALRGKPVAVAGDAEARHGIVLAKNDAAKRCGVATGNPLWLARQRCPGIIFIPPDYDRYLRYSELTRELYGSYTDRVEPYGLDECWLDVTESAALFGDGKRIADDIRRRIRAELGVTASVGVSFNKVFAKLGSDLRKPDATSVVDRLHFRESVWPLPAGALLFVGASTRRRLEKNGVRTIGDLARSAPEALERLLGKNGRMLWLFANGCDDSPVARTTARLLIRSVGNGTTAPRDLTSDADVKLVLNGLCESVSSRLRKKGVVCGGVQGGGRDADLQSYERQRALPLPCRASSVLLRESFALFRESRETGRPVRSLYVRAYGLADELGDPTLLPDPPQLRRAEALDAAVDRLRERFGYESIQKGLMLTDRRLAAFAPTAGNAIHPDLFFKNETS